MDCARRLRHGFARRFVSAGAAVLVAALAGTAARANDNPVILQWFETSWDNIENRMPDAFMAGYGATWLPSPVLASFNSAGYDPFDRFHLGRPGDETTFGTEQEFRELVREFKRASIDVYIEGIFNHNGGRSDNPAFLADGGWPGFFLPGAGNWGDFHNGATQSTNPNDPNYNLFEGDLVGLIDIAQETNNQFIRHPIEANPLNLPPGNFRNRPDPANRRFYTDPSLPPMTFTNPGPLGNNQTWTVHPFNTGDPSKGAPVVENITGLLMRWAAWMIEDVGVDGYRLDASKHVPQWWWNTYFDPAVFNRRTLPSGQRAVPFSFGENVIGNNEAVTWTRKDGFGNRDALDLNEAGALRDLLDARGLGSWLNVLNASIDATDDGFNNGTLGVHHVWSHDNGSDGLGVAAPPFPHPDKVALVPNAFVLFRSGVPIIYHNGREMHTRFTSRGFWPKEGNPTALGNENSFIPDLVRLHNQFVRGGFYVQNGTDPVNSSLNDVIVIERSNTVAGNVLVALSDSYSNGFQYRSVQTSFPPGTRLHEQSGVWADTGPNGANLGNGVARTLVVDSNRRVLVGVPNNRNNNGVQHERGYVVYAPAVPSGTVSVSPVAGVIPAESASVPTFRRRLTSMEVITAPTFDLTLQTTQTDSLDGNTDDFAVFRFNQGFQDLNGNGSFDQAATLAVDGGYERFLTENQPLRTTGVGRYRQTINTDDLPEGVNYLSVIAYRHRSDGGLPLFTEFRRVVYVDREPPAVSVVLPAPLSVATHEFRILADDRTTNSVHVLLNPTPGVNPLTLINTTTQASRHDRFEWRRTVTPRAGSNTLVVVAYELSGNVSVGTYTFESRVGTGDINSDGVVNLEDVYGFWAVLASGVYLPEADMSRDGTVTAADEGIIRIRARAGETTNLRGTQR